MYDPVFDRLQNLHGTSLTNKPCQMLRVGFSKACCLQQSMAERASAQHSKAPAAPPVYCNTCSTESTTVSTAECRVQLAVSCKARQSMPQHGTGDPHQQTCQLQNSHNSITRSIMPSFVCRVQRSFLSAAKHGRSSPGIVHKSPSGMKDSPGQSVAYSASSEDAGSTSGRGQADEASSVEVGLCLKASVP